MIDKLYHGNVYSCLRFHSGPDSVSGHRDLNISLDHNYTNVWGDSIVYTWMLPCYSPAPLGSFSIDRRRFGQSTKIKPVLQ